MDDKEYQELNEQDKDEEQKKRGGKKSKVITELKAPQTSSSKPEYSPKVRQKIDDVSKRKAFKEESFEGRQTIPDRYSENQLSKNRDEAKAAYGKDYNKHAPQVDHTEPLKIVYEKNRYNPFFEMEDIKEIANIPGNYKVISGRVNQKKGGKKNHQAAIENNEISVPKKAVMILDGISAGIKIDLKVAELSIRKATKQSMDAIKDNLAINAVVISGQHMYALIVDDEDLPDAMINIGLDFCRVNAQERITTISSQYLSKGIEKVADQVIKKEALKTLSDAMKQFSKSAGVSLVVSTAFQAASVINSYMNGEISTEKMIGEMGRVGTEVGTAFVTGTLIKKATEKATKKIVKKVTGKVIGETIGKAVGTFAGIVGAVIGQIVGAIVGDFINCVIFGNMEPSEQEKHAQLLHALAQQIDAYNHSLESILMEMNLAHESRIRESFVEMRQAILDNNAEGINTALSRICYEFGCELQFKTDEEFVTFLESDTVMYI